MFKLYFSLGLISVLFLGAAMSADSELEPRFDISEQNNCEGGCKGLPGRDGRDGRDSINPGPPGKAGKNGPRGLRGLPGRQGSVSGTVFTRWGRKICPHTSKLVYEGVMGGSHFTHTGGGSNYLCLPKNPIYEKFKAGAQGSAYIYGTEYQLSLQPNIFPKNLHDHDAPCAVCHAESRGSQLMIPARNQCPVGWVLEYKGYLMAELYTHKGRTQYICVDEGPSSTHGGQANANGALLYFVESQCGSLPCPPYVQGQELTCAVCTK